MNETKRSKGGQNGPNNSKGFYKNMNMDSSVVSFINEKPGTSDINAQPNNRKIRVNRKL